MQRESWNRNMNKKMIDNNYVPDDRTRSARGMQSMKFFICVLRSIVIITAICQYRHQSVSFKITLAKSFYRGSKQSQL